MTKETYVGIHGTSNQNADKILEQGFKIFSPNHYLGPGVYFYADTEKGRKLSKAIAKKRSSERIGNFPILLWAKFSVDPNSVIDVCDYDSVAILEDINRMLKEKMDGPSFSKKEYDKRCNELHIVFIEDLRKKQNIASPEMICACIPYGREASKGYVLPNPDIIYKYLGMEFI